MTLVESAYWSGADNFTTLLIRGVVSLDVAISFRRMMRRLGRVSTDGYFNEISQIRSFICDIQCVDVIL